MKELHWRLGVLLDILHAPLALAILPFGRLWMPIEVHVGIVAVVVLLQAKYRTCPLNVASSWLRRKKNPDYTFLGSITFLLYQRHGRWVGVPIFIGWLFASWIIRGVAMSKWAVLS